MMLDNLPAFVAGMVVCGLVYFLLLRLGQQQQVTTYLMKRLTGIKVDHDETAAHAAELASKVRAMETSPQTLFGNGKTLAQDVGDLRTWFNEHVGRVNVATDAIFDRLTAAERAALAAVTPAALDAVKNDIATLVENTKTAVSQLGAFGGRAAERITSLDQRVAAIETQLADLGKLQVAISDANKLAERAVSIGDDLLPKVADLGADLRVTRSALEREASERLMEQARTRSTLGQAIDQLTKQQPAAAAA